MDPIQAGGNMGRPKAPAGAVLLLAGLVYAFWPPPPAERGLWLLAWAALVVVTYAVIGLVRSSGLRIVLRDDTPPGGDTFWGTEAIPASPVHPEAWRAEVAHDVRTPLMRMRLTLDELARSGEEGALFAAHLEGEVLRLEHLAEDLIWWTLARGPKPPGPLSSIWRKSSVNVSGARLRSSKPPGTPCGGRRVRSRRCGRTAGMWNAVSTTCLETPFAMRQALATSV